MPVYAYKCKSCRHQFDARQSFSDEPLRQCPQCEGELRKQFNTVGVVFKGSGFYRTDSRAGASETSSASSGGEASSSASSSTSTGSSAAASGSSSTGSASSAASG